MDVAGKLYPTGRIGTTNYILTQENIVNDMINMLPADFWTPDVKVLSIPVQFEPAVRSLRATIPETQSYRYCHQKHYSTVLLT